VIEERILMKKKLLPSALLVPLFLVSCTLTFSSSKGTSTLSRTETSVLSVGPVRDALVSSKDGSSYGYRTKAADRQGDNFFAKSTSFTQNQVALGSNEVVLNAKGQQKLLVIPVSIRGYSSTATEANRERIAKTFFGDPKDTSWESLASYYAKSSFGQLILQGSVSDWYDCGLSADQISAIDDPESDYDDPTWTILNNALAWYKAAYHTDAKEFDNDGDGYIDGIWLVYSAPDHSKLASLDDTFWAYTYSAYDNKPSTASPQAWRYCWASFDFMDEGYGKSGLDAHTYIHETGHLLGLDDYYVSESEKGTRNYAPMGAVDMMDANIIDHNAYSKFAFGWIDPLVVSGSASITLKPASSTGEAVLIPTGKGWNGSAFDEYMLLEYYTPTDLNALDAQGAYQGNGLQAFTEKGVRVYHVDARLAQATVSGTSFSYHYTDKIIAPTETTQTVMAHSNSNSWNVKDINDRLIQEMDCTRKRNFDTQYLLSASGTREGIAAGNDTLFQSGDSFSFALFEDSFPDYYYEKASTMNDGSAFEYAVSFGAMSEEGIALSITKA
jgi:M6 family metalloprotease-like protein